MKNCFFKSILSFLVFSILAVLQIAQAKPECKQYTEQGQYIGFKCNDSKKQKFDRSSKKGGLGAMKNGGVRKDPELACLLRDQRSSYSRHAGICEKLLAIRAKRDDDCAKFRKDYQNRLITEVVKLEKEAKSKGLTCELDKQCKTGRMECNKLGKTCQGLGPMLACLQGLSNQCSASAKYKEGYANRLPSIEEEISVQGADCTGRLIAPTIVKGPKLEIVNLDLLDANPLYFADKKTYVQELKSSELIRAKNIRQGTTADGVSQLVIRLELKKNDVISFKLANENDGKIEPLLEGKTITTEGFIASKSHYTFALYTPPTLFEVKKEGAVDSKSPLAPPKDRLNNILEKRDIKVLISSKTGESLIKEIILARPPVVLVHGLFSDPIQTWIKTTDKGSSMAALLERAGFLPFLVNYQNTNGMELTKRSWMGTEKIAFKPSSFEDNKSVVWDSPLVSYEPVRYEYGYLKKDAIISELQKPKDTRIGGIKQALSYYRQELSLAATQAIVIGHSMGGLLARVWASDSYNTRYKRPENFGQGDINHLLTLNTPHYGSELIELKDAIGSTSIKDEGWVQWGRRQIANTVIGWFIGPGEPEAMRDLRPGSQALLKIGNTSVPSYAITTSASSAEMGDKKNDPDKNYQALYSFAGMMFFNNRPLLDDFVENRFKLWQEASLGKLNVNPYAGKTDKSLAKETVLDISKKENREKYKAAITNAIDHNSYYWAARRGADYQDELRDDLKEAKIFPFGTFSSNMGKNDKNNPLSLGVQLSKVVLNKDVSRSFDDKKTSDVPDAFLSILRDLVFHHDPNTDGAVRVISQAGGIDKSAQKNVERILHSYSTWDYRVQRQVLFLLKRDIDKFSKKGFPVAGKLAERYMPSTKLLNSRVTGEQAITWSGMVPSHADEYLKIADNDNVFILARPVNPSSTQLLANCERSLNRLEYCAAAKGMNVKGKSSSWGPQIGYIPADQRYSKLWRTVNDPEKLKSQIIKYNKEVEKSLTKSHPEKAGRVYAVERPLNVYSEHSATQGSCAVLTDPGAEDAEQGVFLYCNEQIYRWQNGTQNKVDIFDANAPLSKASVDESKKKKLLENPMMVLADDTSDLSLGITSEGKLIRPYLTADYDLLAIGFPFESAQCKGSVCRPDPTPGVRRSEFDSLRGFISPKQNALVTKINEAVKNNAGYEGGLVTHHGPENQYPASPYVDYPILVFDPMGEEKATAYLIRQGSPGFRDIHLKRFFTQANRSGYNLWPNPNSPAWRWEARRSFDLKRGYAPRDASNLPPYVEEAPMPAEQNKTVVRPIKVGVMEKKIINTPSNSAISSSDKEEKFWSSIKELESKEAIKLYLNEFANGRYVQEAKQLLKQYATKIGNTRNEKNACSNDADISGTYVEADPEEAEFEPTMVFNPDQSGYLSYPDGPVENSAVFLDKFKWSYDKKLKKYKVTYKDNNVELYECTDSGLTTTVEGKKLYLNKIQSAEKTPSFKNKVKDEKPGFVSSESETEKRSKIATQCDKLAASPWDESNKTGFSVNDYQLETHVVAAIKACNLAVGESSLVESSQNFQSRYQLARTLLMAGEKTDAIYMYEQLKKDGYIAAIIDLGMWFALEKADYKKAKVLFELAKEKGSLMANLGFVALYEFNKDLLKDTPTMIKLLQFLVDRDGAGSGFASWVLGNIYLAGDTLADGKVVIKKDSTKAIHYFKKAMDKNVPEAFESLAEVYENGLAVTKDYQLAINLYKKAIALSYTGAKTGLERVQKEVDLESKKKNKSVKAKSKQPLFGFPKLKMRASIEKTGNIGVVMSAPVGSLVCESSQKNCRHAEGISIKSGNSLKSYNGWLEFSIEEKNDLESIQTLIGTIENIKVSALEDGSDLVEIKLLDGKLSGESVGNTYALTFDGHQCEFSSGKYKLKVGEEGVGGEFEIFKGVATCTDKLNKQHEITSASYEF